MPVWGAFLGTLGYNYWRHRHGRSTLCSAARTVLPAAALDAGWDILTWWMKRHYRGGFIVRKD